MDEEEEEERRKKEIAVRATCDTIICNEIWAKSLAFLYIPCGAMDTKNEGICRPEAKALYNLPSSSGSG